MAEKNFIRPKDARGKYKKDFLERLSDNIMVYGKLVDPKTTTAQHITEILNLKGESDTIVDSKVAVLANPNATKEHVEIALKDKDASVVYNAILCPSATDGQIKKGVDTLIGGLSEDYRSVSDLEKNAEKEAKRWRSIDETHSKSFERLIKILSKSKGDNKESLKERAKKRID